MEGGMKWKGKKKNLESVMLLRNVLQWFRLEKETWSEVGQWELGGIAVMILQSCKYVT